nr:uncharacterized protein LOC122270379 [Parasteatoda tepidariorum]
MTKGIMGRARLNFDELYPILCEAESNINNRPLTYLSEDVDGVHPLTLSLFLQEIRFGSLPELDVYDSAHLNKRFRYCQKLKDIMERFCIEYLGQLKNYSKNKLPTTFKVGQIVLVGNDNAKRLDWPMAKILELYPGVDRNSRVARIKTMNGELVRPYQKLYPLEVEDEKRSPLIEETASMETSNANCQEQGTRCDRVVKPVQRLGL